jgi:hypothetical protein
LVLVFSLVGFLIVFISMNSVNLELCLQTDRFCRTIFDRIENIFYFLLLLLSLITYFLPPRVFQTWLKFSLVWVPIVFISNIIITTQEGSGSDGFIGLEDILVLPTMFVTYGIFVFGSIISIVRGYNLKSR